MAKNLGKTPCKRLAAFLVGSSAAIIAGGCWAASSDYPNRPVRIVVPFVAGGVPDFITRVLGPRLAERIGQPVVVDNRPGAGGKLGTEYAATTAPDGYTLVIAGNSNFGITPALHQKNIGYNPAQSFSQIARIGESRAILVTHPSFPARTVRQLIDYAKQRPDFLNYGSSGNGTTPHLFGEMFKYRAGGLKIRHVPYRGGPQALTAIVSGEVEILMGQIAPVRPFLQSGRVRALAVSGHSRSAALPKVPTFGEAGVPGMDATIWYVFAAPAGTPREIIATLNGAVNDLMRQTNVREQLAHQGIEATRPLTPEEATAFVRAEMPRWAEAVRLSGARVN